MPPAQRPTLHILAGPNGAGKSTLYQTRLQATANAEFGNAAAVLVGDFLYSRAFQMMVEAGSMPVMQVMADATNVIAEGEVLQLLNVLALGGGVFGACSIKK